MPTPFNGLMRDVGLTSPVQNGLGPPITLAGMYPTDMGTMPPGSARVVPDKMYDVPPILDLGRIDEPSAPVTSVQSQQWWDMYDALQRGGAPQDVLDYHISQNPWVRIENRWTQEGSRAAQDADVMIRAIDARQRPATRGATK